MIAALVVVYLYNFKVLPVERSMFAEEYVTNLIAFLNIGLTGFVVASLAARFVYPSIGAEGGSFYIIMSSPLSAERYILNKYFFYAWPFTCLALILLVVSNGAILFLFTAIAFEMAIIFLGGSPVYRLMRDWLRHGVMPAQHLLTLIGWIFFSIAVSLFLALYFIRIGINKLKTSGL